MQLLGIITIVIVLLICLFIGIFLVTALAGAPYVPTLKSDLSGVFTKLYQISEKDTLIDLGAGDGVVLKYAAKHGAKAIGVELNPILAFLSSRHFKKDKNIKIKCKNFYRYTFPEETTVVYAFAVSLRIESIYQKIQSEANHLNKTLYFISNAFDLKDQKPVKKYHTFYLYKVEPKN